MLLNEITNASAYPDMDKDEWIPASGGSETPFMTRSGKKLLYCWNPKLKKHAYLDMGQDIILSDEEARAALGHF